MLIVALGVPLAVQLQRRAAAEVEGEGLVTAGAFAAAIGPEDLEGINSGDVQAQRDLQQTVVQVAALNPGTRVIVVASDGTLFADSDSTGPPDPGRDYATPERQEIVDALAGRPGTTIRHSDTLGTDLVAAAVPIFDEGSNIVGAVRVTRDAGQIAESVRRTTLGLLAIGAAALLAGLLLAFGLAGSLSRPLSRLAATATRLGSGDLQARADNVRGAREIEELGHSFDEMADRLERTVLAQREFVANASHQLRTPLTGMKLRLEAAIGDTADENLRLQLEAAEREVDRLSEIVNRLLEMSRAIEEGEPTHVDLSDAISRALARWSERATSLDATLRSLGEGGSGQGNPSDLDQILDNLLDNAISYGPGEITVESGARNGYVFVAVQDRGPGIPKDELPQVTERFYRGRGAPSGGSGLGLAIARDLAEKWGGTLDVSSTEGEGTRVEVRLRAIS